jgi:hypothetical protein
MGRGQHGSPKERENDAATMQQHVLFRDWWDKKQQRSSRQVVEHSRFMKPLCKEINIGR